MHQGSVLSCFLLALVVDVVTEFSREGALSELLYADDLVQMIVTMEGLGDKFLRWKDVLRAKLWKLTLQKPM